MRRRGLPFYGANPLHLLVLLASLALAGYAALRLTEGAAARIVVWFLAAAVIHDLFLFPLYALADAAAVRVGRFRRAGSVFGVRWVNHVRVPVVVSGTLLLVCLPLILGLSRRYPGITGYTTDPYLARWLLLTAGLFALSAGTYAVRLRRARRARSSRQDPGTDPQP